MDLPQTTSVFPLVGALLLPGGRLPLNVFEPRYLAMIDLVMGGSRIVGMVQPTLDGLLRADGEPCLSEVGCLGRVTSLAETGDGRYLLALDGICRFRILDELAVKTPFRQCRIAPFVADLDAEKQAEQVNRSGLLKALRDYVEANGLEVDWNNIARAGNETLVNALSMMAPYGPAEKQALLEADDLKSRAEMLVAMTEIELARGGDSSKSSLQ
jgi:Lon protease-like protein